MNTWHSRPSIFMPMVVMTAWICTAISLVGARTRICEGQGLTGRMGAKPSTAAMQTALSGATSPQKEPLPPQSPGRLTCVAGLSSSTASSAMVANTQVLPVPDLACTMRSAKSGCGSQGSAGGQGRPQGRHLPGISAAPGPTPRPARPLTQAAAPQRDGLQLHGRGPMEAGRLQPSQHRRRQQEGSEVCGAAGQQHVPGAGPARRLPGRRHLGAPRRESRESCRDAAAQRRQGARRGRWRRLRLRAGTGRWRRLRLRASGSEQPLIAPNRRRAPPLPRTHAPSPEPVPGRCP